MYVQSGAVIIILSFSFVVFCLLFLFACVVLPHYVVNKDEYINWKASRLRSTGKTAPVIFASSVLQSFLGPVFHARNNVNRIIDRCWP